MAGVFVSGGVNLDLVARVQTHPQPGETILARSLSSYPGGKGANQASACSKLGYRTGFLGAVGADEAGGILRRSLQAAGVDTASLLELNAPTGQAMICVADSGENTIVVSSGANMLVEASHVRTADLAGYTVFLTQFEAPLPVVDALFSTETAQAGLKVLNCAPALAEAKPLLGLADIIILNEGELANYAGLDREPTGLAQVVSAARRLIRTAGQIVVVTLGGAGAVAVTHAQVIHEPGRSMAVVDTTGAGDCFCGAFAGRLSDGRSLAEALAFANAAAAIAVSRPGAASSMPSRDEVEALLAP